jgi:hypothetical protein
MNAGERRFLSELTHNRTTAQIIVARPLSPAKLRKGTEVGPPFYGYRPKRCALDAVKRVHEVLIEGNTDVVDADLSKWWRPCVSTATATTGAALPALPKDPGVLIGAFVEVTCPRRIGGRSPS